MAGRSEYIISHPNGEEVIRGSKGGKVPTFATWAFFSPYSHRDENGDSVYLPEGWHRVGWSFQTNDVDAQKKCLPDFHRAGVPVKATRCLPARP